MPPMWTEAVSAVCRELTATEAIIFVSDLSAVIRARSPDVIERFQLPDRPPTGRGQHIDHGTQDHLGRLCI